MPSYKLTYFDGRGRAELVRLLFVAAGQSFEDERLTQDTWQQVKPNTPFGQLPVLEVDGKKFGQSVALANYLAREFGYGGQNALEGLAINQVVQLVQDFISAAVKVFRENDEAKKADLQKNFAEVEVPKYFGFFAKLLSESGTGYFVGSSLTLADLAVFDFVSSLEQRHPGTLDKCPPLKALSDKVLANEKIKTYVANRKETAF